MTDEIDQETCKSQLQKIGKLLFLRVSEYLNKFTPADVPTSMENVSN